MPTLVNPEGEPLAVSAFVEPTSRRIPGSGAPDVVCPMLCFESRHQGYLTRASYVMHYSMWLGVGLTRTMVFTGLTNA